MAFVESGEEPLRILLVGSGGREHALLWKLAQAPTVEAIFVAPGTPLPPALLGLPLTAYRKWRHIDSPQSKENRYWCERFCQTRPIRP